MPPGDHPPDRLSDQPTGQAAGQAGYRLEEQVGYLLRLANQRHAIIFQNHAPEGLTPTQFSVLVRLAELGACSQNLLGRQVSMDVATIKGVVDRLRAKGLVAIAPDKTDLRRTTILPTQAALDMIHSLHRMGFVVGEETLSPLSHRERETFLRLLKKIT